ncbi:unnamed protein product, partial [Rotaria sp. Silwood1]
QSRRPVIPQNNNSSKNERTSLTLDHHRSNNSDTMMIELDESDTVNMTSLIIDDVQELQTRFQASKIFTDIHPNKNDSINNLKEQVSLNEKDNSIYDINKSLTTQFNSTIVEEMSTNDNMNSNAAVDVSNSVEYDYPTDDSMNIRNSDTSLQLQQQQNLVLFCL